LSCEGEKRRIANLTGEEKDTRPHSRLRNQRITDFYDASSLCFIFYANQFPSKSLADKEMDLL
ncbi:hypothetical protein NDU88_004394, partial [Pleurodeles waltl]